MDDMMYFIKIAYCLGTSSLEIYIFPCKYISLLCPILFVAMEYSKVHRYTVIDKFTIIGHLVSILILVVIIIKNAAKDIAVHIFFCTRPIESLG